MKEESRWNNSLFNWICLIVIIILLLFAAWGCTSSKHITEHQQTFDSSWTKSVQDSNRVLRLENSRLETEINELTYAGVRFDTVYVPGRNDTIINTVVITKEGEVKATGKISSAFVSKNVFIKTINEKQVLIDSLVKSLSEEKKNVKIEYRDRELVKKVSVFPWWFWLIVAGLGFAYVRKIFLTKTI